MSQKKTVRPSKETAQQAKAEADARREDFEQERKQKELGGRQGPDPARYGDWENKGIASDF